MTATRVEPVDEAAVVTETQPHRGKRLDIQGLRAIAVAAVVAYHVEAFGLPGGFIGVDVFFVISGFLMTSHLVREVERTGHVPFVDFYGRRIRRLIPAATAVLAATAAATYWLLPTSTWEAVSKDILGSAFYSENWVLAQRSVDYLSQDALPSPLQHFWSLAVEEQFYIIWPAVILAAVLVLRAWSWLALRDRNTKFMEARRSGVLLAGLALIAVPSFAYSVVYTATDPSPAYFSTLTRLWELAVGGFVAILGPYLMRMGKAVGAVVAWLGLAGIIASMFVIHGEDAFPGAIAVLPTVATAAALAGGFTAGRGGPGLLLNRWPAQVLGDWSYSVYLWHWPIVVIVLARFGRPIPLETAAGIIGLTLILAWLSYRFIEEPVRKSEGLAGISAIYTLFVVLLTVSCVTAMGLKMAAINQVAGDRAAAINQIERLSSPGKDHRAFGAEVLPADPLGAPEGRAVDSFKTQMVPAPSSAVHDYVPYSTTKIGDATVTQSRYGSPLGDVHVALVGDSHAAQWLAALKPIAEDRDWDLTAYIHDSCPFADGQIQRDGRDYVDCNQWNKAVSQRLLNNKDLDAVITSNYTNSVSIPGGDGAMAAAFNAAWTPLTKRGVQVIAIRDNPRAYPLNIPECAAVHQGHLTECAFPRAEAVQSQGAAQVMAARGATRVRLIDLNDAICPTDPCAPAIGGVLVYRDISHLTGTYVLSLRPRLEAELDQVPGLQ